MRGLAAEIWRRLGAEGYFSEIDASVEDVQECLDTLKANKDRGDYLFIVVRAMLNRQQDLQDYFTGKTTSLI